MHPSPTPVARSSVLALRGGVTVPRPQRRHPGQGWGGALTSVPHPPSRHTRRGPQTTGPYLHGDHRQDFHGDSVKFIEAAPGSSLSQALVDVSTGLGRVRWEEGARRAGRSRQEPHLPLRLGHRSRSAGRGSGRRPLPRGCSCRRGLAARRSPALPRDPSGWGPPWPPSWTVGQVHSCKIRNFSCATREGPSL